MRMNVGDKVVIRARGLSDPNHTCVKYNGWVGKVVGMSGSYIAVHIPYEGTFRINAGYYDTAMKADKVSSDNPIRPNHYKEGGIEPIEYMRQKMSKEAFVGFCMGNVMKYVGRYEHKNGVEDLKKAQKYLEWGIERYGSNAD